jgi:hypothetical protein
MATWMWIPSFERWGRHVFLVASVCSWNSRLVLVLNLEYQNLCLLVQYLGKLLVNGLVERRERFV